MLLIMKKKGRSIPPATTASSPAAAGWHCVFIRGLGCLVFLGVGMVAGLCLRCRPESDCRVVPVEPLPARSSTATAQRRSTLHAMTRKAGSIPSTPLKSGSLFGATSPVQSIAELGHCRLALGLCRPLGNHLRRRSIVLANELLEHQSSLAEDVDASLQHTDPVSKLSDLRLDRVRLDIGPRVGLGDQAGGAGQASRHFVPGGDSVQKSRHVSPPEPTSSWAVGVAQRRKPRATVWSVADVADTTHTIETATKPTSTIHGSAAGRHSL